MNLFLLLSVIFVLSNYNKVCLANSPYDLVANNQDDDIIIVSQESEPDLEPELDQKSIDYSYLIPNDESNTAKSDYDYELFKHQYDLIPDETESSKGGEEEEAEGSVIYIPVEYSIDSQDEVTIPTIATTTTTKKAISLTTIILNSILNTTKFNQTNTNSTYRSEVLNVTSLAFNNSTKTALLLNNQINQTFQYVNSTTTATSAQVNRTTLASKKTIEKTILKLESSFDEMYDIDAIPRQSQNSLGHLIEKRIHNNNGNNNNNNMMIGAPSSLDLTKDNNEMYHHRHHHYHNFSSSHAYETFIVIGVTFSMFTLFIIMLHFCLKNNNNNNNNQNNNSNNNANLSLNS